MTNPTDYIKLLIYRETSGRDRYLWAFRATADYYGWTQEFEIWTPKTLYEQGGYKFATAPNRSGRGIANGGKRIRISRSKSTCGNPRGLTNQFTISNSMRMIDLAELANFTQGDWHWMEDLSGQRVSREHWAEIYRTGNAQIGRGLVVNCARLRATVETRTPLI